MITAVIPTINEEKYLPACLDSLKRQTIPPNEIIVVDSDSADKTKEIAKSYGCKVINAKCNIGVARNIGVRAAKGETIVFVDADTVIPDKWIERCMKFFESDKVIGYMCLPNYANLRGRQWLYSRLMRAWHLFSVIKLPISGVCAVGFAVKRKAFESIGGFKKEFDVGEDTDLEFRLRKTGKKIIIDKKIKCELNFRRWEKGGYIWWTKYWIILYIKYIFHKRLPHYYPPIR
jgi:glycosyltransferase involved in cell wall biosynthesis